MPYINFRPLDKLALAAKLALARPIDLPIDTFGQRQFLFHKFLDEMSKNPLYAQGISGVRKYYDEWWRTRLAYEDTIRQIKEQAENTPGGAKIKNERELWKLQDEAEKLWKEQERLEKLYLATLFRTLGPTIKALRYDPYYSEILEPIFADAASYGIIPKKEWLPWLEGVEKFDKEDTTPPSKKPNPF